MPSIRLVNRFNKETNYEGDIEMKELQYDVFLDGCFIFRATETYFMPLLKSLLDIIFIGEGVELTIKVVKEEQNNESNTNEH